MFGKKSGKCIDLNCNMLRYMESIAGMRSCPPSESGNLKLPSGAFHGSESCLLHHPTSAYGIDHHRNVFTKPSYYHFPVTTSSHRQPDRENRRWFVSSRWRLCSSADIFQGNQPSGLGGAPPGQGGDNKDKKDGKVRLSIDLSHRKH